MLPRIRILRRLRMRNLTSLESLNDNLTGISRETSTLRRVGVINCSITNITIKKSRAKNEAPATQGKNQDSPKPSETRPRNINEKWLSAGTVPS